MSHSSMLLVVPMLGVPVLPSVLKLSIMACENVCACSNHVLSECKLLAVEDKHVSVFVKIALASSALLLKRFDLVSLVFNELSVMLDMFII